MRRGIYRDTQAVQHIRFSVHNEYPVLAYNCAPESRAAIEKTRKRLPQLRHHRRVLAGVTALNGCNVGNILRHFWLLGLVPYMVRSSQYEIRGDNNCGGWD